MRLPVIDRSEPALNNMQRLVKRLIDLVLGSIVAILSFIPMLFIAIAIKLDSNGPVFFLQQRVGENGSLFTIYKFRTMFVGAEKTQLVKVANQTEKLDYKQRYDARITRIGWLLRRASIDELPQLINVFKGEMSLVGPRPELPWLAEKYEPWQLRRLSVPQGMTGWWQINGRSDKPLYLHTDDDIYYVQNYSLSMDFYILLKTIWVVVRGTGAY